jgi:hypothetical protein
MSKATEQAGELISRRHSRESGNPFCSDASLKWIPAFAGMTAIEFLALFGLRHRQTTLSACDPSCRHGFAKRMPDSSELSLE